LYNGSFIMIKFGNQTYNNIIINLSIYLIHIYYYTMGIYSVHKIHIIWWKLCVQQHTLLTCLIIVCTHICKHVNIYNEDKYYINVYELLPSRELCSVSHRFFYNILNTIKMYDWTLERCVDIIIQIYLYPWMSQLLRSKIMIQILVQVGCHSSCTRERGCNDIEMSKK